MGFLIRLLGLLLNFLEESLVWGREGVRGRFRVWVQKRYFSNVENVDHVLSVTTSRIELSARFRLIIHYFVL